MLFITVSFIIIEFLVFLVLVIGAIALSHLGLLLVGRIDAFLSPENRQQSANSSLSGNSSAKRTTTSHPELRGNS